MSHSQEIHPFEQQKPQHYNNEEYTEVLNELNQQVVQHQPEDILQFCATFFLNKLEEERAKARQYDHHPLGEFNRTSLVLEGESGRRAFLMYIYQMKKQILFPMPV